MKKLEITVNNQKINWEEKSYAQLFRNFWTHFMELDLDKTVETIELAGVRTSSEEYFISKNGAKKKNIFVKDDLYVYTHLTPKAMEKTYDKFLMGWEGKFATTQPVDAETPQVETPAVPEAKPEVEAKPEPEVKKLTPRQEAKKRAAEARERQMAEKARKKAEAEKRKAEKEAQKAAEVNPNAPLTAEELKQVTLDL